MNLTTEKNNYSRKRLTILAIVFVTIAQVILAIPVNAASVKVYASRDDIYKKIEEAAKVNVIMNNLKKCLNATAYNYTTGGESALSGSAASAGKIFKSGTTTHTTALWLEDELDAGDDGGLWCHEGQSDDRGLLVQFSDAIEKDISEIVCDGGRGRILRRAHRSYTTGVGGGQVAEYYYDTDDMNCNSFNDDSAYYLLNSTWESELQAMYNQYITDSGNDFLPSWDNIGKFSNTDGYISYMLDFNSMCEAEKYSSEPSDTTVYPVTKFDNDIEDTGKVNAKTYWYHVNKNKTWKYALSDDNPIKSCVGLLERVEYLRTTFNGVHGSNLGWGRSYGYEGSIIYALNEACKNLKTSEGTNAWTDLKEKLAAVVDSDEATSEQIDKAAESLDKIATAESTNKWYSESGDEEDDDGKTYQCLDIDELVVTLDEYSYGSEDKGEGEEGSEADCYTNAGSLGWILCPIINQGADFIADIYEKFIEPFLVLDSGLFKTSEEGGEATFEAWMQFQGYANIVFIILFLVVILSQLTGYGVDNYNIKKILPKLIVAAILINASYVICQLAVDIANIIGYGIKNILSGVGYIEDYSGVHLAENSGGGLRNGFTATSILVVLVGLLVAPAILSQGSAILVPIFIAIIGIVVAIFTLFCLLAIRKAMAVVLVIISPLAFVCYMLPNTKKLYDRWFTTFKGVLLAFPICALMVYGGQAVARIIVHACGSSNMPSLLALSAAVMSIAPVFLIPSVLKKSMGAVSALVSRMSGGLDRFAKGRAMNTRAARYLRHQGEQRQMARQSEFNNRRAAGTMKRMNNRMARSGKTLGDMSASQRRAYMTAANTMAGHDAEQQRAFAMSFDNMSPEQVANSFQQMVANGKYDKNLASAAIQNLSDANKHDVLNSMLTGLGDDFVAGKNAKMTEADRVALGKQLAGLKGSNAMAGMYGKALAKGKAGGFSGYMAGTGIAAAQGSGFAAEISQAGKNILSTQDDSALKFMAENMKDYGGANFTDEQIRNSIGNLDTKQQTEMNKIWGQMSADSKSGIFSGMSTEQYAKVDSDLATAVGGGTAYKNNGVVDEEETRRRMEMGRDMINAVTGTQRQALMGEDGANIRAGQSAAQQAMSSWGAASAREQQRVANEYWDTLDNATQKQLIKDALKVNRPASGSIDAAYLEQVKLNHFTSDPSRISGAGYRA